MFGFGAIELLAIGALLLLVIGAGRFPGAARQAGQLAGHYQRYRKLWQKLKMLLRLRF
jgi:Sec-independent protein translocase protein TatA